MLYNAETSVALRCPECSKVAVHEISLFSVSRRGKGSTIKCSCGKPVIKMGYKNETGKYVLKIHCALCGEWHTVRYSMGELLDLEIEPLCCKLTSAKIGFIGRDRKEADIGLPDRETISKTENLLYLGLSEEEFEDYFLDPEVMHKVLAFLHRAAEEGGLVCKCGGSDIALDIYHDHLELICSECGRTDVFYARDSRDLRILEEKKILGVEHRNHNYKSD